MSELTSEAPAATVPSMLTLADLDAARKAARLLDDPSSFPSDRSGLTRVLQTSNGDYDKLEMWSKPHVSGVKEYYVFGIAPVSAQTMYKVLLDNEYHTSWDEFCAELRTLAKFEPPEGVSDHSLNYWIVRYPAPLRRRDYVYERMAQVSTDETGTPLYSFVTKAREYKDMPEVHRTIRVTDFTGTYVLKSYSTTDDTEACQFFYSCVGKFLHICQQRKRVHTVGRLLQLPSCPTSSGYPHQH